MPFCARPILPTELSRRRNGEPFDTLEEVTNHSLCAALVQLASLCHHTESMFELLQEQQEEFGNSLGAATNRITRLSATSLSLKPNNKAQNEARSKEENEIAARCGAPMASFQYSVNILLEAESKKSENIGNNDNPEKVNSPPPPVGLLANTHSRRQAANQKKPIWHSCKNFENNHISDHARPHYIHDFVEGDVSTSEGTYAGEEKPSEASDLAFLAANGMTETDLIRYNPGNMIRQSYREVKSNKRPSPAASPILFKKKMSGFDTYQRDRSQKHRAQANEIYQQKRELSKNGEISETFLRNGTMNPKISAPNIEKSTPETETYQLDFNKPKPQKPIRQGSLGSLPNINGSIPLSPGFQPSNQIQSGNQPRIRLGRTPAYQMSRSISQTVPTNSLFSQNPPTISQTSSFQTNTVKSTTTTVSEKVLNSSLSSIPEQISYDTSNYENSNQHNFQNNFNQQDYTQKQQANQFLADQHFTNQNSSNQHSANQHSANQNFSDPPNPHEIIITKANLQRKIRENYLHSHSPPGKDRASKQTTINYFTPPRLPNISFEEVSSHTLVTPDGSKLTNRTLSSNNTPRMNTSSTNNPQISTNNHQTNNKRIINIHNSSSPNTPNSPHVQFKLPEHADEYIPPLPKPKKSNIDEGGEFSQGDILPPPPQSSIPVRLNRHNSIPGSNCLPPPPLKREPFQQNNSPTIPSPPMPPAPVSMFPKLLTTNPELYQKQQDTFKMSNRAAPPVMLPDMAEIMQARNKILKTSGTAVSDTSTKGCKFIFSFYLDCTFLKVRHFFKLITYLFFKTTFHATSRQFKFTQSS